MGRVGTIGALLVPLEKLDVPQGPTRMRVTRTAIWLWLWLLLCPAGQAQDKDPVDLVKLPELTAYKLPKGEYLIWNARVDPGHAEFIRSLRKVPAVHPEGVPTSLIIEKYLHKKSQAVETDFCYIESDWLTPEELTMLAAVVRKATLVSKDLLTNTTTGPIKEVLLKTKEDYYALVDAWAESDKVKKQARHAESILLGKFRCGYRSEFPQALTLIAADSVVANLDPYIWSQVLLKEGLHSYLGSQWALEIEHFFSMDATTPVPDRVAGVRFHIETAKEYLSRSKRDSLETILRSELNELNPERLSVAFALINFILEKKRDRWETFRSVLAKESYEGKKLKGPEGRWAALVQAIKEAFGLEIPELDRELQAFTAKHYLYPEEIAKLVGVDAETPEPSFEGYVKICELKRQKQPVSEKGERLYQTIQDRVQKKLDAQAEKF